MKCSVDPQQLSNMLGHEEAVIPDLPVTVPDENLLSTLLRK